jgi:L-fucose mutarotase/ribose pyranase (RbsD/FucU family)
VAVLPLQVVIPAEVAVPAAVEEDHVAQEVDHQVEVAVDNTKNIDSSFNEISNIYFGKCGVKPIQSSDI